MSNFFKDFKKDFFNGYVPLKPISYIIVIIFIDGGSIEQHCIENPWSYMKALKKNPKIKTCYIKTE